MFSIRNQVKTAVDRVGGPTIASGILQVSNGSVHNWISAGRVPKIYYAKKLAELSGLKVEELRGMQ